MPRLQEGALLSAMTQGATVECPISRPRFNTRRARPAHVPTRMNTKSFQPASHSVPIGQMAWGVKAAFWGTKTDDQSGSVPLHTGKVEQPQNCAPARVP